MLVLVLVLVLVLESNRIESNRIEAIMTEHFFDHELRSRRLWIDVMLTRMAMEFDGVSESPSKQDDLRIWNPGISKGRAKWQVDG